MSSLLRQYVSFTAHQKPTVGDIKMSAVGEDHLGWLVCDGRELNVSDWRALHNAIGYQFGGSGATFNLPNPAGCVLGTIGTGSYSAPHTTRELGDFAGEETHTLTINEMPAHKHGDVDVTGNTNGNGNTTLAGGHTHTATDSGHTHSYTAPPGNNLNASTGILPNNVNSGTSGGTTGTGYADITIDPVADHIHTTKSTGGSQPHNNMQPTLFVGNTFIYGGKPTNGTWPLAYNPPALSTYGGMPQIL